ncbi:hypothetical protein BH11BAC1_BH11BAC1_28000 [soil metagenome]
MSKKKLADASTKFSPEEIAKAIEKGRLERALKNGRFRKPGQKVGRNDFCPCGSGLKNKFCHNAKTFHSDGKHLIIEKTYARGGDARGFYKAII